MKFPRVLNWFNHLTERTETNSNGCWIWLHHRSFGRGDKLGYGHVSYEGKRIKVHRLMFMISHPEIDITDLQINHRCDNSLCINPQHLYVGTHADNMRDKSLRGRTNPLVGETNPRSRFTDAQIIEILKQAAAGRTNTSLGIEHNVHTSTISKIVRRQTWRHIA